MPILEVAILPVIPALAEEFEQAFTVAQPIIRASPGYRWHQLQRCLEKPSQYLLLVEWETLTDHTEGFRQSVAYQEWKRLLHHFYEPFPVVEHYQMLNAPLATAN